VPAPVEELALLRRKEIFVKNIFTFQTMWSTKLITLIYWVSLFVVVVFGLSVIFGGAGTEEAKEASILIGTGIILIGTVSARLWCEMFVVIFKIHDNLKVIADKIDVKKVQAPTAG
jgi:hypothetical protein